jgi:hypothetical protein
MKTTFFIAAILLVSTASYSQASISGTQSADVNGSAASLKTPVLAKPANLAKQTAKQTITNADAEKQQISGAGKSDVKDLSQATDHNAQVSAGTQTSVNADASVKSNNSTKDASLSGQSSLSASGGTELKKEAKTAVQATGKQTSKSAEKLETATKATDAKLSTKTKKVGQSVRPKPVFVKMNTHLATTSAIKIK